MKLSLPYIPSHHCPTAPLEFIIRIFVKKNSWINKKKVDNKSGKFLISRLSLASFVKLSWPMDFWLIAFLFRFFSLCFGHRARRDKKNEEKESQKSLQEFFAWLCKQFFCCALFLLNWKSCWVFLYSAYLTISIYSTIL